MPSRATLVHQSSISTGTGDFSLSREPGKQTFAEAFSTGATPDVFDYFIAHRTAAEWERGTGHMSSAATLVRDSVLESSNSDAAVDFSDGLKDIANDVPADKQATLDTAQTFTATQTLPNDGLHLLDTDASHDLIVKPGSDLTADRTFTLTTGDADRTISLGGDITTAGDFTLSGAFSLTLTLSGATSLTLPTTGTLATLGGTETLTNKTIDSANNTLTLDLSEGTLTGTTAEFNTALSDDDFATLTNSVTLTNKALTAPDIDGGTADGLTSLGIRSTGTGAFDLQLANSENLTAARALTVTLGDAARSLTLQGNPTLDDWFDQSVKQADSPTFATVTASDASTPDLQSVYTGVSGGVARVLLDNQHTGGREWWVVAGNSSTGGLGTSFGIRDNTAGAYRLTINLAGEVDVPGAFSAAGLTSTAPLDLSGASAGQIAFPATQNPSAEPNTLDDYEEGTWTPALTFATPGDLSVAYAAQEGNYVKIGRFVMASYGVTTSTFTHTTASGLLNITGFPFRSDNPTARAMAAANWSGITKANYTQIVTRLDANSVTGILAASGSGQALSNVDAADVPSGGTVTIRSGVSYIANS